ncbi:MAG: hypothetical protein OYI31_00920 [Chloroflexota bacterium]|nr:hypothetical protein [Chloroflexota bacterium]MDE2940948.1 hypothetical protein [Chloroflexota bacterium]MDE3267010.1 hypothetical protein [Chloroflexota bacterium]
MEDGLTEEEEHAISTINRILDKDPEFGKAVLDLWWVEEAMPTVRFFALRELSRLVEDNPSLAWQAIREPFMEPPFRYRDQYALSVLKSLAQDGPHNEERKALLTQLGSQTWFSDGIDDLDAALLYAISMSTGDFRQALLDEHYVASATVELPLSGNVGTVVIRNTPFPTEDHTLATMEEGLRYIEGFMGRPFPVDDIILIVTDPDIWRLGGRHWAYLLGDQGKPGHMTAHMAIGDFGHGPLKRIIYHEIAHYYHMYGSPWIQEGTANFLEAYVRDQLGVESIEDRLEYFEGLRESSSSETLQGENETIFRDIYELSQCEAHGLGEQFMLGMYVALGPEALSVALNELHDQSMRLVRLNDDSIYYALLSQTTDENIEAFKTAYRRYHGGSIVDMTPEHSPDWPALAALYESTNGAGWMHSGNWVSLGAPLGAWYGVQTDYTNRVWDLDLEDNSLAGRLPPGLEALSSLRFLKLAYNSLEGTIPPELGRLSSLETLDLRRNQLNGEIPPELGDISNLESLSMWGNQLGGEIPAELGRLSRLTWLDLDRNSLVGEIPSELAGLVSLEYMSLRRNRLSGQIPPELGSLSNLRSLLLEENQLEGTIPSELARLSNLWSLRLWGNQLSGEIPSELGGLSNLSGLDLGDNMLTGGIPSALGGLANLESLDLAGNELTGEIPIELGNLSNLYRLDLSNNNLAGEIPSTLEGLAELHILYLGGNQFTGCIPEGLREVPQNDFDELGLPFCGVS